MILEHGFTILEANIMSDSIVVLAYMLKIANYSTDLTYDLNLIFTLIIPNGFFNGILGTSTNNATETCKSQRTIKINLHY